MGVVFLCQGRLHLGCSFTFKHTHTSLYRIFSLSLENSQHYSQATSPLDFTRGLGSDSRRICEGASPRLKLRVDIKIVENDRRLLPRARWEPHSKVSGPHWAKSIMGNDWYEFVGFYTCMIIKFGWKYVSWMQECAWFMKLDNPYMLDWLIVLVNMWFMPICDHALLGFTKYVTF